MADERRPRRLARPGPARSIASDLALAAATALDADLVGVDLLPLPDGGFVVLEVNGAVDFGLDYSPGGDVFARAMAALCAAAGEVGPPALAAAASA